MKSLAKKINLIIYFVLATSGLLCLVCYILLRRYFYALEPFYVKITLGSMPLNLFQLVIFGTVFLLFLSKLLQYLLEPIEYQLTRIADALQKMITEK